MYKNPLKLRVQDIGSDTFKLLALDDLLKKEAEMRMTPMGDDHVYMDYKLNFSSSCLYITVNFIYKSGFSQLRI